MIAGPHPAHLLDGVNAHAGAAVDYTDPKLLIRLLPHIHCDFIAVKGLGFYVVGLEMREVIFICVINQIKVRPFL